MRRRARLRAPVVVEGIGLHTGAPCAVLLEPAPWGSGLTWVDSSGERPASIAFARAIPGATVLGETVTTEHLLAALLGAGITDARCCVEGPEVPALDGSALPWCAYLAAREEGPALVTRTLPAPVRVEKYGGVAEIAPASRREVAVSVDFGAGLPQGSATWREGEDFSGSVAWARTFAFSHDLDALRATGRGKGASIENTVVYTRFGEPLSPLRGADEAARHKLLDAIGDLALLGPEFTGKFTVHRGSHALHLEVLRLAAYSQVQS